MSENVTPFRFPNTYLNKGVETGVISHDGYFRAVKARLVIDSVFKFHKYIRIFMESGVFVTCVVFWLGRRAIDVLDYLPP